MLSLSNLRVAFFMHMNKIFKILELFLLFVVVPGLLATSLPGYVKLSSVICALLYVCFVSYKNRTGIINFKITYKKPPVAFVIRVAIVSVLLIALGVVLIQFIDSSLLFIVVKQKTLLWVVILFVYAFLSVIPQELIYRRFFYNRYSSLFSNKKLFSIINVICFSWCHVFLNNIWVMLITVLGGILFVYTYEKERNLRWVVIEHSIYGNLVFTLGLGQMLAFPM